MADKQSFVPVQAPEPAQGNAEEATTEANPTVSPVDANVLTEDKVRGIVESALSTALRKVQSDSAKQEQRIKKEVERRIEELSAAGVSVTPEQQKQLETIVRKREIPQPAEETETLSPAAEPDGENVDPVTAAGYELMDQYGLEIDAEADPEAKMIDHSSPLKYLRTLEDALKAKSARSGKTANVRQPMGGGTPAANPIKNITDLDALFEMSRKKTR